VRKRTGKNIEETAKDDLSINPLVNAVLDRVGRAETFLIGRGVRLPFGTSIFLVARKPLARASSLISLRDMGVEGVRSQKPEGAAGD